MYIKGVHICDFIVYHYFIPKHIMQAYNDIPKLLTKDSTQCAARESGNEIHLKTISIKAVKLKKKSSYNGNINYLEKQNT